MKLSYVYILANKYRTTFYIGITGNLKERMIQHKKGVGSTFTSKYNIRDLIYFEEFSDINQAILREKQLKNWHHDWKINLIKVKNPKLQTLEM
ncbi:GIY-YIG nuclease family protein [Lutibacter sp.]|uniref:GIY-YIG nuclease family protein n=1 Tax=Lutibacter sp. TaxID=1925666 RepID=UPI0025C3C35B|nr:GIY-YIG nuclease family protein [Lutibacter sp.]MCF6182046.1 GIY-YIG nuclease family protein [Lutibacter sp.]